MRIIFLFLGLATLPTLKSQNIIVYAKEPAPGFAEKKIAKDQMAEDIRFWQKVMEESHVNLYHAISKESLEQMESGLLSVIKDSITQQQAVLLIGKLAALLNEGHIGLPSSSITDSLYINSIRFPYLLQKVLADEWIVDRDLSTEQKLGVNARILSVNNIPVTKLYKRFREYYGGLETWRRQQINTYVRKLLYLSGIQSPYHIKALSEDGRNIEFTATGYTKQQADSINKVLTATAKPKDPYTFEFLPENIAYINYRSMTDQSSNPFASFLNTSFTKIKDANAKGLIIDLRENGGGNSVWGELLVSYFTKKSFRFAGGMKWKISEHYKAYLNEGQKIFNVSEANWYKGMKNGELYTSITTPRTPAKKEPFFEGKVCVLIGPNTFSSANMMADGIKSYQLATLFGEPTGESGNDFGEMFNFMLPNSHIIARASTKMFTRADGDEKNFDPVIPNITVIPTAADIKNKKDVVLESAVNWILNKP
jgi:hypothetical protein